jgi:GT2 family glycosyltransferase
VSQCSIGVVNYNTRELLRQCLVAARAENAAELLVVDNGSNDGSGEMVRSAFPEVRFVAGSNVGFGGGCNRLLGMCRTEYLLLLNSDAILKPGALGELIAELDRRPRAAIAAPRLYSRDGSIQRSWRQFPGTLPWLVDGVARRLRPSRGEGGMNGLSPRKAPWVFGAAMAVRVAAMRHVNGFDTDFFMYCEDIDICYRLWRAGWEVRYVPRAAALHVGGASTGQARPAMSQSLIDSTLRFYRKHYSGLRARALTALLRGTLAPQ